MKTIKIKFTDFHKDFDYHDSFFYRSLVKRYDVILSDEPDYVIYSVWGLEHLKYNCIKIYYTAEDISPDFNLCDYAVGFDDIQFGDRYLRFSLFPMQDNFEDAAKKHLFTEDDIKQKTAFCDYIVSNGKGDPIRTEVFKRLNEYKKVDSGGRYLNNIGGPVGDKYEFQKRHKFSIAFENGAMPGYTTEKIIHAFAAKTVPIYWGNPDIAKDFNTKSFINYWDYGNLDDVINRVIELDNNDDLYREVLSQPIFMGGVIPEHLCVDYFEKFLYHIFDQPLSEAGRRCMYTWRKTYVWDMNYYRQLASESKTLAYRVAHKINSILGKRM